ncbi:hypothetical protein DL89DRAFT_72489 [Linderina pennispora]|uniref:Tim17-domain-containing protein n=1 Tax=Linderina pennispora TaxID=61395 RepID=A0A1Y1VYQ3_9FUNG|nr:uncharacterized protein DL89DRAFT_72489 [Linderina pennispora]ORX66155.1 hypothetical protein DL89DRAFT_72489 [Linderina pennispora]
MSPIDTQPTQLQRIRLNPFERVVALTAGASLIGAVGGGYLGGQLAGRQYLAERAHRLPKTADGWFFYQKWKNYRVTYGGFKGAVRYASRIGGCVLAFATIEAMVDRAVGEAQALSSAIAGVTTALGVSLLVKLPRSSAKRAGLAGLAVGLTNGLIQDGLRCAQQPTPPSYISWLSKQTSQRSKTEM